MSSLIYLVLLIPMTLWVVPAVIRDIRMSYLSGFKFYFISGLIKGVPFLPILILFFTAPSLYVGLVIAELLFLLAGNTWTIWCMGRAHERYPTEWEEWENKLKQTRPFDRLLFYRGVKRKSRT